MATCKDRIHYDLRLQNAYINQTAMTECSHFKNKADFVEVVRCKDCKYAEIVETNIGTKYIECQSHEVYMEADDYCSYGIRKDNT